MKIYLLFPSYTVYSHLILLFLGTSYLTPTVFLPYTLLLHNLSNFLFYKIFFLTLNHFGLLFFLSALAHKPTTSSSTRQPKKDTTRTTRIKVTSAPPTVNSQSQFQSTVISNQAQQRRTVKPTVMIEIEDEEVETDYRPTTPKSEYDEEDEDYSDNEGLEDVDENNRLKPSATYAPYARAQLVNSGPNEMDGLWTDLSNAVDFKPGASWRRPKTITTTTTVKPIITTTVSTTTRLATTVLGNLKFLKFFSFFIFFKLIFYWFILSFTILLSSLNFSWLIFRFY